MYSRKIYATGSATANGAATITVPSASTLVGVNWACRFDSITDNAAAAIELSLASATELNVNAAQQCISEIEWSNNFVTSGLIGTGINLFVPVSVRFAQGQFIYMHFLVGGTVTVVAVAILWFS